MATTANFDICITGASLGQRAKRLLSSSSIDCRAIEIPGVLQFAGPGLVTLGLLISVGVPRRFVPTSRR